MGLEKFITYLRQNDWSVFGPVFSVEKTEEISPFLTNHQPSAVKKIGQILIKRINDADELTLDGQTPFYSFKRFFVPERETLFQYEKNKFTAKKNVPKIALAGINILDLQAVNLYDRVFAGDPYYQSRRKNILIIGYSLVPGANNNIFHQQYDESILQHLPFDIFLAKVNPSGPLASLTRERSGPLRKVGENPATAPLLKEGSGGFKVFTGSIKGQRILEHFGYKDYKHIQFNGPIKNDKSGERMERLRDRLKNHHRPEIWEKLGKICIECGKCTLACPTCFCFRIDDEPGPEKNTGDRNRCWDSCYYQEFSEVSGPEKPGHGKPKFLNSTAGRLHFWYYHKFARIPDEFGFMGCVGCHRCAVVCPVGIDIRKVLEEIENS